MLGTALGAAVVGALFGPVVGVAAALSGRGVVFGALAGLSLVLAGATMRLETIPGERASGRALLEALANRRFAGGLLLITGYFAPLPPRRPVAAP